jgi:hypothetical protein
MKEHDTSRGDPVATATGRPAKREDVGPRVGLLAFELLVLPPPDLAHSAGADRRQELVGPEPRSGLDGHEWADSTAG